MERFNFTPASGMGRADYPVEPGSKLHLERVVLRGDYDKGGAYWGGGRDAAKLWVAYDDEGHVFVRAASRASAKQKIILTLARQGVRGNTFYR
jgi:hypothetical protein